MKIGKKIKHPVYGVGKIIRVGREILLIEFDSKLKVIFKSEVKTKITYEDNTSQ